MEPTTNNFNLNSTNIVQLVWSKRKLLAGIGVIALLVSLVASFLITPQFKATAIIYAPVNNQPSKELLTSSLQAGLTVFGDSKESEQLLQVLSSGTLRDIVIKKLGLMVYWKVNPSGKHAHNEVNGIFNDCVKFRPTQYQSVEIEVMDASPEMSAKIANTIIAVEDSLMLAIKAQVTQRSLIALESQKKIVLEEMRMLEDSLSKVMSNGVIDLQMQTQEFFRAYAKAVSKNDANAIKALEKKMEPLKKYGVKYLRFIDEIRQKEQLTSSFTNSIKTFQIDASQTIPSQFVVDYATASDKKAYPKKSIVIILSTLSALFLGVLMIIIADFFKHLVKEQE
jgi:uncharacterized protein involved in exopolysaccharide biosynthesis